VGVLEQIDERLLELCAIAPAAELGQPIGRRERLLPLEVGHEPRPVDPAGEARDREQRRRRRQHRASMAASRWNCAACSEASRVRFAYVITNCFIKE
jgi:hypothetical protein